MKNPVTNDSATRTHSAISKLDPRLTFETFVVGPANRLAAAAARRAADSPGTSYNPLFIYAHSGLGKSHILNAIAHQASREEVGYAIRYQSLEGYINQLAEALAEGSEKGLRKLYQELDILLLDDVQFLAGQAEAQEMLLQTLDSLSLSGKQIVLASDRPPAEIDGLDARLVSRFSGGLLVDMGTPEYETRVAIIRRKLEERQVSLNEGVDEVLARHPFKNVRELGGALNHVLAVQELEEREVPPAEVTEILGLNRTSRGGDEFKDFLAELTGELSDVVESESEPRRRMREAADAAEARGYAADRLRRVLASRDEPSDVDRVILSFQQAIIRLQEIETALEELDSPWSDAAKGVLRNPDRIEEAEALLASALERIRPFPIPSQGPALDDLDDVFPQLAIGAARQFTAIEAMDYSPLYLWSRDGRIAKGLLAATARSLKEKYPEARIGLTSITDFADDFIRALSDGVAGAWRERWWTADYLVVFGLEALTETERVQDEFFHLFEALKRSEARVLLAADRPPSEITGVADRLQSRFEGGLTVEVTTDPRPSDLDFTLVQAQADESGDEEVPSEARQLAVSQSGDWFPSAEKAILRWPEINMRIVDLED